MSKTVKELAAELGVTKQTIQYHYKRLPTKNQQKNGSGYIVINALAEKKIKAKVTKTNKQRADKELTNKRAPATKKTDNDKKDNSLIILLEKQLEELKQTTNQQMNEKDWQIANKDQQIASKDKQIDKMQKLLDQSQQLQLIAENKIKQLEEPKKAKIKEPIAKENVDEVEEKKMKKQKYNKPRVIYREKRSFWDRFNRW